MSLDVLRRVVGVTGGSDVRGQTRPNAEKQPGKPWPAAGIMRGQPGILRLTPLLTPTFIPMAYANQLTSSADSLQSP